MSINHEQCCLSRNKMFCYVFRYIEQYFCNSEHPPWKSWIRHWREMSKITRRRRDRGKVGRETVHLQTRLEHVQRAQHRR